MVLQAFDLEWWPVSRDSLMYGVAVLMLINVLRDGRIEMTEALSLVLAYIFYILSKIPIFFCPSTFSYNKNIL